MARHGRGLRRGPGGDRGGRTGLVTAAAAALDGALDRAHARYATHATCLDLLAALVDDPESRAVEVLRRASVDTVRLAARLDGERSGQD
ncbi:hypothetical protein SRIMM317S_05915 [Streptomyces rimosus subsp. rimosus]